MSIYVVDASTGVKWFVPEVDSDAALRLQNRVWDQTSVVERDSQPRGVRRNLNRR